MVVGGGSGRVKAGAEVKEGGIRRLGAWSGGCEMVIVVGDEERKKDGSVFSRFQAGSSSTVYIPSP